MDFNLAYNLNKPLKFKVVMVEWIGETGEWCILKIITCTKESKVFQSIDVVVIV
jgi:hypothetical protein